LFIFHFIIKPQLSAVYRAVTLRCLLFHFIIKPQRRFRNR